MRSPLLLTALLLPLTACGEIKSLISPRPLTVARVAPVQLKPGQGQTVTLDITLAEDGTPISDIQVSSPAPELVTATVEGTTITLKASANALPQGYLPITVDVQAGKEVQRVRIPVEIGTLIEREYARFNALRAQANLPAVTFNAEASMNCWLNGRYMLRNNRIEHNQNPSLPFASPEGQACASTSNLAISAASERVLPTVTPSTTYLFSAPFHALGMLQPGQISVGIGTFTAPSSTPGYAWMGSGITSANPPGRGQGTPMTFPGNGASTDLGRYNGGEWPDPLTACPGLDASQTGLPLIAATYERGATTASDAVLTEAGQPVPVCAYGSAQYVNTKDAPGNYVGGARTAQDIGRSLMEASGAVFLIPARPLKPGQTYQASVKINGKSLQWSFRTAASLAPQALETPIPPQIR